MINEHWARWVRASCRKHFDERKQTRFLHFEGLDRGQLKELQHYTEFRIDGPNIIELSRNYYRLDVTINILISNKMTDDTIDQLVTTAGVVQSAFTPQILIYRYGSGELDTGAQLGCLQALDRIKFNNFGQVDETIRLEQASVEGRYRLYLGGDN